MPLNVIYRLDLSSKESVELADALDRVIEQPIGTAKGNHANLCWVMHNIFGGNFTKREAIEGAIWALWREGDLAHIVSVDPYVAELQQELQQFQAHDDYWMEQANLAN